MSTHTMSCQVCNNSVAKNSECCTHCGYIKNKWLKKTRNFALAVAGFCFSYFSVTNGSDPVTDKQVGVVMYSSFIALAGLIWV